MRRLPMTLALATTVALAGVSGATPPGVDPALPEPADEPPNPERIEPYYDGSVQAPPPCDPAKTDLGAPPVLPTDEEPIFGQNRLPRPEEEEAE